MIKSFKYKLNPTFKQAKKLNSFFGAARFIYNWGLNQKINSYNDNKTKLSYVDLAKMITPLKKQQDTSWLNDCANECLQQSLRCLDVAFTRFFREKKGFPKFKSKHKSKSVCKFINSVHFDFNDWKVKIPKIGWVKLCHNKEFDQSLWKLGTLTVFKDKCGEYWCTIVCRNGNPYPTKAKLDKDNAVGIDLGIKDFAILSDGTKFSNPKFLEFETKKLARLQRVHSRRQKGSKRRERARLKLAKCHRHIADKRLDFLHKLTTQLVNSQYDSFCLEDLNVEGMMQNHHLARAIQSVSWYAFKAMLEYKCELHGKNIIYIGRFEPSSKMCSVCGYKNDELKLSDRQWICPICGTSHDRDINAAINIKNIAYDPQNLVGYASKDIQRSVSRSEDVELPR